MTEKKRYKALAETQAASRVQKQGTVVKRFNAEEKAQKSRKFVQKLRPIDDDFMRCIFRENLPLTQEVLRILTGKEDLIITAVDTQADLKRLGGARSVCFDAYGRDSDGARYDLEIQRTDQGACPRRARYHASVMDIDNLDIGHDFNELPETYVIFITENDYFGEGEAIYSFERMNAVTKEYFDDGQHILYVNAEYRGEDEIGWLMHDFFCDNWKDMKSSELAKATKKYKDTQEGVSDMSAIVEEFARELYKAELIEGKRLAMQEGLQEGRQEGRQEGLQEGRREASYTIISSLMKNLKLSLEQAMDAVDLSKDDRDYLYSILNKDE